MYTAFGLRAADVGQPAQGVPWFVAAAELMSGRADNLTAAERVRVEANRLRFHNWPRVAATPVRALLRDATMR